MSLKQHKYFFFFIIFMNVILYNSNAIAQTFEHIESLSDLAILEENNGVAIADYDGDLDLDIFVVAKGKDEVGIEKSISRLFRNDNNGGFTDVTTQSGLINLFSGNEEGNDSFDGLDGYKFAASWGDYDNDGFPDLFFTHSYKIQLFHNQGDGTFIDVTNTSGITGNNSCDNTGATWVDYNNDRFLDIFINDWEGCDSNTLYKNNGNGTFQNVTLETNISSEDWASYTMLPFDFNNDGLQDLYISNDLAFANTLFINQSGTSFTEQATTYGLNNSIDDMGITVGDFNLDGHFDLFITGISENALLQNDGTNNFSHVEFTNNIGGTGWAWGCRFADFDLDGDEDIFIPNGFKLAGEQSNVYYKNLYKEGQNTFVDASNDLNLDEMTMSISAVDFDYDNDGDLDLYVTNTDRPSFFYENKLLNGNESTNLNWFKVSLQGTVSNRDALGTTVTITTNQGTFVRYYSGVGFLSQSLKPVHFGLGETAQIEELKITWPSGLVEIYPNLSANIHLKATENSGYEILNIQPSIKIAGCTDPDSCTYNPLATIDDGSCEYIASGNITGTTQSGFNRTETYSYTMSPNSQVVWTVEGGILTDGQGTNIITVKWGLEETGKIAIRERNDVCTSNTTELTVDLSITNAQENVSTARIWNEALLEAIRNDFARPTVHARNLFHTSVALYDVWAIYTDNSSPYLVGKTINGYQSNLQNFTPSEDTEESIKKAMSYAAYRLLSHRFKNSPGSEESLNRFDLIMEQLNYDTSNTAINYELGDAAALGNYVGQTIINYGLRDGSREATDYDNSFYQPSNPPLMLDISGETGVVNPNKWQPLTFNTFIDQSGNLILGATPKFLGPEWGKVLPFALNDNDKSVFQKGSDNYTIYHNPGMPPQLNTSSQNTASDLYKWNFALVSKWSSHLDPTDGVMWDISPKSIGNIDINLFPNSFSDHQNFYNETEGGDISIGHGINPITGQPYETQMVPRADYARVLAEFWADGPDSETPPGHWFTILNYVNDHPLFTRKFNGKGLPLSLLEWDVKAYFILSGAMHDSAITAWGIKGWFDYIRPISAIRYMSELGQSTDENLPNYHVGGIPLDEGFIELVKEGDALSGQNNENVGKIKVFAWRGHDAINDAETDVAGVGWILAVNWWPYQRPSFVTPPFAGYVSGHSTFSRAAAEVMTLITGDEFFPGGMGEFVAIKDDFLVFEKGPSVDVKLQWATYRDASDQTSLSRIWGGIHPPADDIPGRIIGKQVGIDAYNFALPYFNSNESGITEKDIIVYPNPVVLDEVYIKNTNVSDMIHLFDVQGRLLPISDKLFDEVQNKTTIKLFKSITPGLYILKVNDTSKIIAVKN